MSSDSSNEGGGVARRCRLFRITGRVQGVWFRGSTQTVANRLQIAGYAVNKPDGSVEVLACGSEAALEQLEAWLHQGPTGARVDALTGDDHPDTGVTGFTTGRSA